jgi:hypothetical protein
MANRKDPNQKGSGAKKHGREYRAKFQEKYRTSMTMTRYRLRHNIPAGRRKDLHRDRLCPIHKNRFCGLCKAELEEWERHQHD